MSSLSETAVLLGGPADLTRMVLPPGHRGALKVAYFKQPKMLLDCHVRPAVGHMDYGTAIYERQFSLPSGAGVVYCWAMNE